MASILNLSVLTDTQQSRLGHYYSDVERRDGSSTPHLVRKPEISGFLS